MSISIPVEAAAKVEPIKAVYKHLDCLVTGIHDLKQAGYRDMQVMTPFPRHEVEELLYDGEPSPVRWFTLCGGIFGATMAFTMASLMSANWPMIMPGGKPLVSVPPFIVITFEGTILWGSLFTFIGLLLFCRLPARDHVQAVKDPRFSNDHFGIVLERVGAQDAAKIKSILAHSGAIEVTGGGNDAHGAHHG
jgi:molybdopterin-containing oxidoreductase family membrane subunit